MDTIVFFSEIIDGYKTLGTKVYFKDTDRHSLLFSSSYHPRHTFSSIIKSQLIRFHRICSLPHHVEEATRTLFEALKPRGYSRRFLRTIKHEVAALFPSDRANFSGKDKNIKYQLIPLVTTFSRSLGPLHQAIRQHFNTVKLQTIPLAPFKVIMAYRRNKNLKDMLVHTALNKTIRTTLDPYFTHLKYISNLQSGAPIWQTFSLLSSKLVYAIQCSKCRAIYVGETGATLKQRLYQHIYHIQRGTVTK